MSVIKGWKFPIQVDKYTGKIQTVEDNENVKQSIKIILGTQKHERKIIPNFGTDLRVFMFKIVDPEFISTLKMAVEGSLKRWEEHIRDLKVSVNGSSGPLSYVDAHINYITDIEPTQVRVVTSINTNQK